MSVAVISRLFETEVGAAEMWGEHRVHDVHPEEVALVAGAAASRIAAFSAGRECARRGLAALGHPPVAVPRGLGHQPLWPAGVTGSITHCRGYVAAVVADAAVVPALGIDAEPHEPLRAGLLELVASPSERVHLAGLPDGLHWDRLLFCIKESVYKAWFPLTSRWLDFHEAEVELRPDESRFTARLLVSNVPAAALAGRFAVSDGVALAAVTHVA